MKYIQLFEELNNNRAKELVKSIDVAKRELEQIQSGCKHKQTKLSQKGTSVRKKCVDCQALVGYPSDAELKDAGYFLEPYPKKD